MRPVFARIATPLLALGLAACSGSPARQLLAEAGHESYAPARFGVCKGYGCTDLVMTTLSIREWTSVAAAFDPPAADAAGERARVAEAIGQIERLVGPKTGTQDDAPGAAIINLDRTGQMDCIDEAFNTTVYLGMLADAGLLRFHEVGEPARRGYLLNGWPHNTATLVERETGAGFAIDSWFHGNGQPADVVALGRWLDGWHPDDAGSAQ